MKRTKGICRNRLEAYQLAKSGVTRKKNMYAYCHSASKSLENKMMFQKVLNIIARF